MPAWYRRVARAKFHFIDYNYNKQEKACAEGVFEKNFTHKMFVRINVRKPMVLYSFIYTVFYSFV